MWKPKDTTHHRLPSSNAPKVLEKALRVLDLFVPERPAWGASEIARELSMPVPTAHRIIRSLESHGYLARSDTRWQLGMAAVELGRRASASMDLRWTLRPALQRLLSEAQETVLLAVYDEARRGVLCIDRFEAAHSLRLSIDIGRITPLHAGAASKALLAFLPEPLIEETLRGPLERLAPVPVSGGQAIASIGIAAPMARYSPRSRSSLPPVITSAAREAERLLDARAAAP